MPSGGLNGLIAAHNVSSPCTVVFKPVAFKVSMLTHFAAGSATNRRINHPCQPLKLTTDTVYLFGAQLCHPTGNFYCEHRYERYTQLAPV